jgi:succinoglycan biosynthesis transport protein ExoP
MLQDRIVPVPRPARSYREFHHERIVLGTFGPAAEQGHDGSYYPAEFEIGFIFARMKARTMKPEYTAPTAIDAREVFDLFRGNLGKIICCTALAIGLAAVYLHQARPVYRAVATLEVAEGSRQNPTPTEIDASDMLKTIELKIASQAVLLGVIRSQQLAGDPSLSGPDTDGAWGEVGLIASSSFSSFLRLIHVDQYFSTRAPAESESAPRSEPELLRRLARKVSASLVRGSRLITITAEDRDPAKARQLAQAVIDEFFRQSRDSQKDDSSHARELLLAEAKRAGEEYKASQEKLEEYRKKFNAVSLQDRQNIVVERLRDLNVQVAAAKNVRLGRESELAQVSRFADTAPQQLLGIRGVADAPDVVDLRKQIALHEAEIATLSQRYGPLHPKLIQAKSQLEVLHTALIAGIRRAGERVREMRDSAAATEAALETALAEQEKAALELDRIAIPYRNLERESQASSSMYQKVLDNLKRFDVDRALVTRNDVNGTEIRVVEPPLMPQQPVRPRPKLLLAISLAAGLFLGCGLAVLSRALDKSITSIDHAETALGHSVFAIVPRSRHRSLTSWPVVMRYPASPQAEAFRSLRTTISLSRPGDSGRCILFTSAIPDEGKSFCSLNFAASCAQQGRRTLLIDGDLRRPTLQRVFPGARNGPDLSACLRDPARFDEAVQPTGVENLFRLGDAYYHQGSAELIGRDAMRPVIERALVEFEQVVIDSAPLLAVSDTLHLAKQVPTVCMVVYAGKTPQELTRRALQQLEEIAKNPAAGLVLNKVSPGASNRYYYYYKA